MASLAIYRPEPLLEYRRAGFFAIRHRYKNEISFVPLNIFEILYKYFFSLSRNYLSVSLDQFISRFQSMNLSLNQLSLLNV